MHSECSANGFYRVLRMAEIFTDSKITSFEAEDTGKHKSEK